MYACGGLTVSAGGLTVFDVVSGVLPELAVLFGIISICQLSAADYATASSVNVQKTYKLSL